MKTKSILLTTLLIFPLLAGCIGGGESGEDVNDLLIDSDSDGIIDSLDNCPEIYNPLQSGLEKDDGQGISYMKDTCESEQFTIIDPSGTNLSTRSSGVTSFTVIPSQYVYTTSDTIEADFIGNWFEPYDQLYSSVHLTDINGVVIYQYVIGINGMGMTSLDTLYPNDPTLGGHVWVETGPSHPTAGSPNNYDFSGATLGAGDFCWDATIRAVLWTTPGVVVYEEVDQVVECFQIQHDINYFNPGGVIPYDSTTDCRTDEYQVTDTYASNITNTQARPQATAPNYYSDPWQPTTNMPVNSAWSPVTPHNSDWIWLDNTGDPDDYTYEFVDFKMSFSVPSGARDVVADFDGLVDNKYTPIDHPSLTSLSVQPAATIVESSNQQVTQWAMPETNMNLHHYFQQGQQFTDWLANSQTSPTFYDLYLSAWQQTGVWGTAFSVEVTYCMPNATVGDDNDPPQVVADIFHAEPSEPLTGSTASVDYIAFLSWDSWDYDGQIVSVYVDHDRDGAGDILLDGEEGSMYFMIIPFLDGIQTNRYQTIDGDCMLIFHRMIDVIATDNSGMTMTYTIRTGVDGVWGEDDDDFRSTTRHDAEWFTNTLQFSSQDDLDWIMGVGNSPCPAPPQFTFVEDTSPLSDMSVIGILHVDFVGPQTYAASNLHGNIAAFDPVTGAQINGQSCGVDITYSSSATNIAAGEFYTITEHDAGDGNVCDIAIADVGNYNWKLTLGMLAFDLPHMFISIT